LPSGPVEVEGDLPADKAPGRALWTVCQYLAHHVLGNADFDPTDNL
jgi:hypothetical protein